MLHRKIALAISGLLLATLVSPAAAQETIEEARARREALQSEAAATASEIDLLEAEDAEIVAALEAIEQWIAVQEARLATAEQQLAAALETESQARALAATLDNQVADLERDVAEQSITTYIGGFGNDDGLLLNAENINSVPMLRFVLDESTGISEITTDQLRAARSRQAEAIAEAEQASAEAAVHRDEISVRLAELETSRADQQAVQAEIERRIDELEQVTATLETEDAEIERFIQAELARIAAEEEARRRAEEEARRAEEERLAAERAAEEAEREAAAQAQQAATGPEDDGTSEDIPDDGGASDDNGDDDTTGDDPAEATLPPPAGDGAPGFIPPVPGGVSSGFGVRVHPVLGTQRMHHGYDYTAGPGTPIGAAAAGNVIFAGTFSGYGNTVIIQHSGGYSTLYAHMSGFDTTTGAVVSAGDTIGFVGSTGLSTGPHLHFEIRHNGGAIDPALFL